MQILNDESQNSMVSTASTSSKSRRLPNILSVASSQKACFLCKNSSGRKRIPKAALSQVWIEKNILIPHENRCCGSHLVGKEFSDEAMDQITATTHGILMTDEELSRWILDLSLLCKTKQEKRKRFDFNDSKNIKDEDYPLLLGVTKQNFETMLSMIRSKLHKSQNRSPREALAIFLMVLRHGMTQVKYLQIFIHSCMYINVCVLFYFRECLVFYLEYPTNQQLVTQLTLHLKHC
jgi:hypothetical protein